MSTLEDETRECIKVLSADGHIIHVNDSGLSLLEATSEDCLDGRRYADIWPLESRSLVLQAIRDAVNGSSTTLEGYCPTFAGTPRWWETTFYQDKIRGGTQSLVIGVSRDISLQRGQALAERLAQERFALLAGVSLTGVLAVSHEGICIYCNPAAAALLGHSITDLQGRFLHQIIHRRGVGYQAEFPGDSPIVLATRAGKSSTFEYQRITHKRGHGLSVSCVVYPLNSNLSWCGSVLAFAPTPGPDTPNNIQISELAGLLNSLLQFTAAG